jgi:hypothetical protein
MVGQECRCLVFSTAFPFAHVKIYGLSWAAHVQDRIWDCCRKDDVLVFDEWALSDFIIKDTDTTEHPT